MTALQDPIDIIYIMGSGRSGSTLLASMLGTQDDIFSGGEIYNLKLFFDSAAEKDRLCSCGDKLLECDFWKQVRAELLAFRGTDLVDPKIRTPDEFVKNNYALFRSVSRVSGRSIIVDSSKRYYRLDLLLKSDMFNVVIVHLVRDPRAYAYSSMLTEMGKGAGKSIFYKKSYDWLKKNIAIKLLFGRRNNYVPVRYEDLVADPAGQLDRILAHYDRRTDEHSLHDVEGIFSHEFSGNSRFREKGLSEIRLDTRYISQLTTAQWGLASTLLFPGTSAFRYPLLSRKLPT